MTKTYTIATNQDLLIACVPDGADLDAAIREECKHAGIDPLTSDDCNVVTGLLLVDEVQAFDEVIWSGFRMGMLSDEDGTVFEHAVRRPAHASVTTADGRAIEYKAAVALMDDELREELHSSENWSAKPQPQQAFFDAYVAAHRARFGEDFQVG